MTSNRKLSKAELRTESQRSRILCAATRCFVRSGFHSASMANIADTAGMSPGLIYRYFESKNSIILAIIEQQLLESRNRIHGLRTTSDLADALLKFCDGQNCGDESSANATLFLEISSEAMRNDEIAEALGRYDQAIRAELTDWIKHCAHRVDDSEATKIAEERALLLACLIEGLKVRKSRERNLDRQAMKKAIDAMIHALVN